MVKKTRKTSDTDMRIQRAQRVVARKKIKGKTRVSEELIQQRRTEALRENASTDKEAMAVLGRAFDAVVASMQDPASTAAFSALLNATPEALRDAAVEYRKHEAAMYRVMKEPHPGLLRVILNIMQHLEIPEAVRPVILGCNQTLYREWVKDPGLPILSGDTLLRTAYLLGIWNALTTLFTDRQAARTWLHHPNSAQPFNGATPLSVITQGTKSDLLRVREYLDSWCN